MDLSPEEAGGASVRADDGEKKRGPGRPKKVEETVDTILVDVVMVKAVQVDPKRKTKKGGVETIPLSTAREWFANGWCVWTDPRPDL